MQIETLYNEHQDLTYIGGNDPAPAMVLNVKYDNGVKYDIWLWQTKEKKEDVEENQLTF